MYISGGFQNYYSPVANYIRTYPVVNTDCDLFVLVERVRNLCYVLYILMETRLLGLFWVSGSLDGVHIVKLNYCMCKTRGAKYWYNLPEKVCGLPDELQIQWTSQDVTLLVKTNLPSQPKLFELNILSLNSSVSYWVKEWAGMASLRRLQNIMVRAWKVCKEAKTDVRHYVFRL